MTSIRNQLVDSSRTLADMTVRYIENDPIKVKECFGLVAEDKYPISMRAARVFHLIILKYPDLFRPYIQASIELIENAKVDGVKRSLLYIFSMKNYHLSDEQWGQLADITFTMFENPKEAIAIRAISLDIMLKLTDVYPELKDELVIIIQEQMPNTSVGLRGRCKKILLKLEKKRF